MACWPHLDHWTHFSIRPIRCHFLNFLSLSLSLCRSPRREWRTAPASQVECNSPHSTVMVDLTEEDGRAGLWQDVCQTLPPTTRMECRVNLIFDGTWGASVSIVSELWPLLITLHKGKCWSPFLASITSFASTTPYLLADVDRILTRTPPPPQILPLCEEYLVGSITKLFFFLSFRTSAITLTRITLSKRLKENKFPTLLLATLTSSWKR